MVNMWKLLSSFRLLGTHTTIVTKTQQQLHFLRKSIWTVVAAGLLWLLCGKRTDVWVYDKIHSWEQEGSADANQHPRKDHRLPSGGGYIQNLLPQENQHSHRRPLTSAHHWFGLLAFGVSSQLNHTLPDSPTKTQNKLESLCSILKLLFIYFYITECSETWLGRSTTISFYYG